jgi:hypothetical protein
VIDNLFAVLDAVAARATESLAGPPSKLALIFASSLQVAFSFHMCSWQHGCCSHSHKEPPPCRTWIWGQADRTQRLIVRSLFSVEFSPIVTNAYIFIFLFMSKCNAPNSLQQFNRPFCQCSMMLPMVKTKGNGTERLYKAFNYAC